MPYVKLLTIGGFIRGNVHGQAFVTSMKSTNFFFLFVVIIDRDGEALTSLILPSALEHDNKDPELQWGLKLNGTNQLLVYIDVMNLSQAFLCYIQVYYI
jgi:hypothetical protein